MPAPPKLGRPQGRRAGQVKTKPGQIARLRTEPDPLKL